MKLCDLIKNLSCEGTGDIEIERIEYNSLNAREGDLFVCLPGARRDGHDFAPRAYENGTRAFLCERRLDLPSDALQIITENTRAALPIISAELYSHPASKLHIIGITGTKGKTTTALLTSAILNAAGKNCAYIGSNGVIINGERTETVNTTPESLKLHQYFHSMVSKGVEYAVIEVSSQALVHHRVDGIPFEVTAFTNLSPDHISPEEHASFEEYRDAKKRLFDLYPAALTVYNADDSASEYMISGLSSKTLSYSIKGAGDINSTDSRLYRDTTSLGVEFDCNVENTTTSVRMMSPGDFSVYNGLCAIAICSHFGISTEFCAKVLARTPVQGRFEIVEGTPGITFIVDYSHNGFSLTNALTTLRRYEPRRIICVFGSVGQRTQCRRAELAEAASKGADYSIITSDNPDFETPDNIIEEIAFHMPDDAEYECITDRREAIIRAVNIAREGDIVLFAGKGHESYQLVCGQKLPFSEREIIEEACAALAVN